MSQAQSGDTMYILSAQAAVYRIGAQLSTTQHGPHGDALANSFFMALFIMICGCIVTAVIAKRSEHKEKP